MKVLLALVVIIAAVGAAVYFSGIMHMDSPADQAKKIKDIVAAGGSWEKVVDVQPPSKYYDAVTSNISGRSGDQKFDRAEFARHVKQDKGPIGYYLVYNMSADIIFEVMLDDQGNMRGTHDLPTMSSLLQPNGAGLLQH